jgi:hypothetical protein
MTPLVASAPTFEASGLQDGKSEEQQKVEDAGTVPEATLALRGGVGPAAAA